MVKAKDSWILWGFYYEQNTSVTLGLFEDGYPEWELATYCGVANDSSVSYQCGFADLKHTALATSYVILDEIVVENERNWTVSAEDINSTTHRLNFTATGKDMDHMGVTGWDTPRFLSSRELTFSIYYGTSSTHGIAGDLEWNATSTKGVYHGPMTTFLQLPKVQSDLECMG